MNEGKHPVARPSRHAPTLVFAPTLENRQLRMPEKIANKRTSIPHSEFVDLDLSGSRFANVDLSDATLRNINFNNASIRAADLSGARFLNIGPAPDETGQSPQQSPVSFKQADFNGSTFENVDLSNVRISHCTIQGMTIDGISVTDMIDAYQQKHR